jgi:hypothetical protein
MSGCRTGVDGGAEAEQRGGRGVGGRPSPGLVLRKRRQLEQHIHILIHLLLCTTPAAFCLLILLEHVMAFLEDKSRLFQASYASFRILCTRIILFRSVCAHASIIK